MSFLFLLPAIFVFARYLGTEQLRTGSHEDINA